MSRIAKKAFYDSRDNLNLRTSLARYELVQQFVSGKLVLDAGCGARRGPWLLAQTAEKVIGVDYSVKAIDYVRRHFSKVNVEYKVMDCCNLGLSDNTFDTVVSLEVIEHIQDQKKYLSEMLRVLKPGGLYIGSTPNKKPPSLRRGQIFNPNHINELTIEEYRQLLSSYFTQVDIYGQSLKVDVVGKFEQVKRFAAKMDFLGLRYLVPIKTRDWVLGRVQAKIAPFTGAVSRDDITEADFEISKFNFKNSTNLIAVCTK
ncbi:MAG: class I SAM-dependent methyltransferase [Candidatus Omnitrophota bacterium]